MFSVVTAAVRTQMVNCSTYADQQQQFKTSVTKTAVFMWNHSYLPIANWSRWKPLSEIKLISSTGYAFAWPDNWCTGHVTLYATHCYTGSQCDWCRMGVMWSHHLAPSVPDASWSIWKPLSEMNLISSAGYAFAWWDNWCTRHVTFVTLYLQKGYAQVVDR